MYVNASLIVCTPAFLLQRGVWGEAGDELPTKFSKKGGVGLDKISVFIGGCQERGCELFQWGVAVFT